MFFAVMLGVFLGSIGTLGVIALASVLVANWIRRSL